MPRSPEGPRTPSHSVEPLSNEESLKQAMQKIVDLNERLARETADLLYGDHNPSKDEVRAFVFRQGQEWRRLAFDLLNVDKETRRRILAPIIANT